MHKNNFLHYIVFLAKRLHSVPLRKSADTAAENLPSQVKVSIFKNISISLTDVAIKILNKP